MRKYLCGCLVLALLVGMIGVPTRAETEETTETAQATEATESLCPTESVSVMESTPESTGEPTTEIFTEPTETAEAESHTPEQTETIGLDEEPVLLSEEPVTVTPIARLAALNPGLTGITFRGTIVWTRQMRIVLQDETGGADFVLPEGVSAEPGDILQITGDTGEIFQVRQAEKQGSGELPAAAEFTLEQAPQALRLSVEAVIPETGQLKGTERTLTLETDQEILGPVQAVGVILDGVFYADTVTALPGKPDIVFQQRHWAGQLHKHSAISGGFGSAGEVFALSAQQQNMDFFAVTDHSDSFDNGQAGAIDRDGSAISRSWASGKQAAKAASNGHFAAIFGYEMTWGEAHGLGHINTFGTPGWQTGRQMQSLQAYLEALKKVPHSVSQFNHPGTAYGSFDGFRDYDPDYDRSVQLMEVFGERGAVYLSAYQDALDAGWHLAPTAGSNGYDRDFGTARTVVLADALTEGSLLQAMEQRHVYATQDSDFRMEFQLNGREMGSYIRKAGMFTLTARFRDPSDSAAGSVEVVTSRGRVLAAEEIAENQGELSFSVSGGYPYYYLRVTQPDGDLAVSAPVWVASFQNLGIQELRVKEDILSAGKPVTLELTFFNKEPVPMEIQSAVLYHAGKEAGQFEQNQCTFTWQEPGEVRLNAQVQAVVEGESRTFQKEIVLHFQGENPISGTISQIRAGSIGRVYQAEGYASTGNTNRATTLTDTIYIQDTTGGIPAIGTFSEKIQPGTPLKIVGALREQDGERYLDLIDCDSDETQLDMKPPLPAAISCRDAAAEKWDGMLVQLQGTLLSLEKKGGVVSKLTIRDEKGDEAVIVIDPEIRSGSGRTGKLSSKITKGKTIRAIGLCAREPDGSRVVRLRNCDEVVYVPPVPDPTNPKTNDPWQNLFPSVGKWAKLVAFVQKMWYAFG